jgi:hypothetical protein
VLLNVRDVKTGAAVPLERTLPREQLVLRELAAAHGLRHCDPAAAHALEDTTTLGRDNSSIFVPGEGSEHRWRICRLGCADADDQVLLPGH